VRTADFDYDLPERLIAQRPLPERDAARMLVLDPARDRIEHAMVRELPRFLANGDLLVLNDSRVIPARLRGRRGLSAAARDRGQDGGEAEVLLLRPLGQDWEALVRPGRKLRAGSRVTFDGSALCAEILEALPGGTRRIKLLGSEQPTREVERIGEMPTPPYIKERLQDPGRYQTIYARRDGSAAAPTAGLHFTPALLEAIQAAGVELAYVTLHIGLDTFQPVRVDEPARHRMHREAFSLPKETVDAVAATRRRGGRVVAVGTTTVRALETGGRSGLQPGEGWTELFIVPGFRFQVVDALLTNFHLPRSTLLMLVSAFAGRERIREAYREAIAHEYRFYSFGDCMLITARGG
jgi:S-adenosylmethionine:tRNA ribosyltransferase-isomerase